jgi:hypothetical protein
MQEGSILVSESCEGGDHALASFLQLRLQLLLTYEIELCLQEEDMLPPSNEHNALFFRNRFSFLVLLMMTLKAINAAYGNRLHGSDLPS